MAKKSKKTRLKPLTKLFLLGATVFMLIQVIRQVNMNLTLQSQLADAKEKLQKVKDENNRLNSEKEKLQDPDYVESYARSNYMLSKDGEQIFYIPKGK
ncbi:MULTISPECIES: septum formation initiator family protein [Terrabacteria group]|uniref:FtsB family cell division protein n=1 Tax=Bacillati TaxID=1783272 RepID=UPI00193ABB15|nr:MULTISPECIES: septum formation initiator family protein [Terrabacteria group]MBW9212514.1 septum formation initiator family protein [Trueperella sp. zg.1013]QRG86734.1 septum formation initiator family protein [Bulleidia sp. zg-1006]